MGDRYVLEGHTPVLCDDLMEWARQFENHEKRRVYWSQNEDASIRVSTVFLGLDHSFGCGPPLLFETMIFGGPHDEDQERCSTWEQAEEMHKRMCARAGIEP